jgi:predicted aconitase with swiveling domain
MKRKKRESDSLRGPPDLVITGESLRGVGSGMVTGEILLIDSPISFLGDVDPDKGTLKKEGLTYDISDRILVFTEGAGSTVGSYVVYNLSLNSKAPRAMVMMKADAIITIGCILGDIPLVHRISRGDWDRIDNGDLAQVETETGRISIWNR